MLKGVFICFLLVIQAFPGLGVHSGPDSQGLQQKVPNHHQWDRLLKKHVQESGLVDYKSFQKDYSKLTEYLEYLGGYQPTRTWKKEELLAYYINLYNAGTVQLILDHYPVGSIKDISRPWGRKFLRMGNQQISLGTLEHDLLRKMEEPRIHFAINCASFSCPSLLNEAYTAADLNSQLERATQNFINDPSRNRISANNIELSKIFKWYKGDFGDGDKELIAFLNKYLNSPLAPDAKIGYLPYNWGLNEKRSP